MQLLRPDDWHLHLRDGPMLAAVLPCTTQGFGRALVMPNLVPPITTVAAARGYRDRITAHSAAAGFTPYLTCYLTDDASAAELVAGYRAGVWRAAKLYPAHATTNAQHGVTDLDRLGPVFAAMAEVGMPLCVHGEVTDPDVDVFDREAVFLDRVLAPLLEDIADLKVVVEHATTRHAVALVREHPGRTAASITPHHLWWNRNAMFDGGLRPHAYCLPVPKREADRVALVEAATSGSPSFFAGTDSAPHRRTDKERDHGCAGVFCAPTALAAYAQVFDTAGALDRLEGFLSRHGATFYGLPAPTDRIEIVMDPWTVPEAIVVDGGAPVRPFLAGATLQWRARPLS